MIKYCVVLMSIFMFHFSVAQDLSATRKKEFNLTSSGFGLEGFDPLSYFTTGKPLKGSKDYAVSYQGITYLFSSNANKEEFKKSPTKYEPQFGGWCAFAMGFKGEKVEIDPETFKIISGKLYLFYNKYFNNTLNSWNKDEVNLKKNAEMNWSKIYR